jgi:BMFP domain-containing protein YqiC
MLAELSFVLQDAALVSALQERAPAATLLARVREIEARRAASAGASAPGGAGR